MVRFLSTLKLRSPYSRDEDALFASRNGRPLGHRNVSGRGFKPAIDVAGIEGVTFHDLRHAFASRMIARGIEVVTLSELMGHEDIRETLNTYAHLWDRVRTDQARRNAMGT
jgi:integrase